MRPQRLFSVLCALSILIAGAPSLAAAEQLRPIAMLELPGQPGFGASTMANGHLVIVHPGAGAVDVFDPVRRRLLKQIEGFQNPRGMAVDEERGRLYVADAGSNRIVIIATEDWSVESQIELEFAPDAIVLTTDPRWLYTSHWRAPAISPVSERGDSPRVEVEGRISRLVWDPARRVLFASVPTRQEVIALTPQLEVAARYPLVASQPTGLALDAEARRLYVAVRSAIVQLDADSGAELARVEAPPGADELWLDAAGRSLLAASSNGTVMLVSLQAESPVRVQELQTQVRGRGLAYDAERNLVYLPGGREGRSKLLILQRMDPAAGSRADLE